MSIFQALILGIVQGLTEFLPVSSSGHLVLFPHLLGWQLDSAEAFVFFVLVQWGTLLAVLVYFRGDLLVIARGIWRSIQPGKTTEAGGRLGWLLLLATLPAVFAGWLARAQVEAAFADVRSTGYLLLGTAFLLVLAERIGSRSRGLEDLNPPQALLIGAFQVLSLLPGISRSGATISGGMAANLRRRAAAHFAFLMAVPVMLAAGVLALVGLKDLSNSMDFSGVLLAGFLAAALVGYAAIHWLLGYLAERSLYPFALYCTAVAALILLTT